MSGLRKRKLSKRISRPNGMKAIARIEEEIGALIAMAPLPQSDDNLWLIEQSNARIQMSTLFACLVDMYTKHV